MTLDASAREANLRDSLKKFFVDGLKKANGIELTFDKTLTTPVLQGTEVDRWVSITFGDLNMDNLSSLQFSVYCCTRKDPEGFRLAQLRDTVFSLIKQNTITLYRSHPTQAWEQIGGLYVTNISETGSLIYQDMTKYKMLMVTVKWGTKLG